MNKYYLGSRGRCSGRSRLSSRGRGSRGGTRDELRTIADVLHTLHRFFNLFSNNQSQTLLIVVSLKLSKLRFSKNNTTLNSLMVFKSLPA
jgi:hypothetical protein